MLVSHHYKFIYLKTIKTAGTSVELYFEPCCANPRNYPGRRHEREAASTTEGIIGYRGPDSTGQVWFNHMPAIMLRERIGDHLWNSYFKFCAIRNPYDKVVSHFWFTLPGEMRQRLRKSDFSLVRRAFLDWASGNSFPLDQEVFMIDGTPVADQFVRYEHLDKDMETVCHKLGSPWVPEHLGRYKSHYRERKEHFSEYHDDRSKSLVQSAYPWELANFDYKCEA